MAFTLKDERLPVLGGILYSLPLQKLSKGCVMRKTQNDLITLIESIAKGDESAMSEFYDVTVNRIYGMAMKVVSRTELAEEVVGDVYLQIWRQATNYRTERASPIGWILMICRSRALDILRREKSATRNQFQEDEGFDFEDESTEIPLDNIMASETSKLVSAALKILNKKQREALSLAFYKGMSHKEISEYTGQPLGSVKSNIRRAQDILRNTLDKDELCSGGFYGKA